MRRLIAAIFVALCGMVAVLAGNGSVAAVSAADVGSGWRELHLYHTHTGERIDIVYRQGGVFVPEAEEQLDHFLRDHRTGDVKHYDPRIFDVLADLAAAVGRPDAEIQIICGYRSSWSNEFLRARSAGVAKNSQHMEAHAIDIRIAGVDTITLRNAALALGRGGVGYYPRSGFVHVDTGRVRTWCYGCSAAQK